MEAWRTHGDACRRWDIYFGLRVLKDRANLVFATSDISARGVLSVEEPCLEVDKHVFEGQAAVLVDDVHKSKVPSVRPAVPQKLTGFLSDGKGPRTQRHDDPCLKHDWWHAASAGRSASPPDPFCNNVAPASCSSGNSALDHTYGGAGGSEDSTKEGDAPAKRYGFEVTEEAGRVTKPEAKTLHSEKDALALAMDQFDSVSVTGDDKRDNNFTQDRAKSATYWTAQLSFSKAVNETIG